MQAEIFTDRATIVWAVLMVASVMTTWILSKQAFSPEVAAVGSIGIAAFKIRLVLIYFMDLKEALVPLRLAFEAWVAAITLAILGLYMMPN